MLKCTNKRLTGCHTCWHHCLYGRTGRRSCLW